MSLVATTIEKIDCPSYRPYRVRVHALESLSPHFTRVTFWSADFDVFGTDGRDQRIKLMFPAPDGSLSASDDEESIAAGDWYDRWRRLPDDRRSPIRTYTVRAIDPDARLLTVDFVAHGDGGPAARWLLAAQPGDELVIVGPDARSINSASGIDWQPGAATDLLLVGDETAAPAIAAILETLPAGQRARAFIEVPDASDRLSPALPANAEITWLDRAGGANGSVLVPAVERWVAEHPVIVADAAAARPQQLDEVDIDLETLWELPEQVNGGFYAWIAGECGTVKTLRRLLVSGNGIDRGRVAFMGYWRLGRAEG